MSLPRGGEPLERARGASIGGMSVTVRALEERDQAAVVALSLRAWAPVFASVERVLGDSGVFGHLHPDWRTSQRQAIEAVFGEDDVDAWVADVDDDDVAGFVAVRLDHHASVGEIHMVAVDPAWQRNGIGARLTSFAVRWMKDRGMAVAMVETGGDPGHAPARRTYEQAGFTELPVSRYFRRL